MNPILRYLFDTETKHAGIDRHPNLLASLMLAAMALEMDCSSEPLRHYLSCLFGNNGQFRLHESVPNEIVHDVSRLYEQTSSANSLAAAYLGGICNRVPTAGIKEQAIYCRQRRIFWGENPELVSAFNSPQIICIVGQKASGKSAVLNYLQQAGEVVLEQYRELDSLLSSGDKDAVALPPRSVWVDEPLKLVHTKLGLDINPPDRLFVGSLLRPAEVSYLSQFGRISVLLVDTPNDVRHSWAQKRGRKIEILADDNFLVELDAHRAGLWPDYELNDLGSLMALAEHVAVNNPGKTIETLSREILDLVQSAS